MMRGFEHCVRSIKRKITLKMDKLSDTVMRPVISGAIAAAGVKFLFDGDTSLIYMGREVPVWLLTAGVVGVSEAVGGISRNYVMPYVDPSGKSYWVQMLAQPALTGGVSVLAMNLAVGGDFDASKIFLLGAGSSVAADYIERTFMKK